jgi:hypothetical protein
MAAHRFNWLGLPQWRSSASAMVDFPVHGGPQTMTSMMFVVHFTLQSFF